MSASSPDAMGRRFERAAESLTAILVYLGGTAALTGLVLSTLDRLYLVAVGTPTADSTAVPAVVEAPLAGISLAIGTYAAYEATAVWMNGAAALHRGSRRLVLLRHAVLAVPGLAGLGWVVAFGVVALRAVLSAPSPSTAVFWLVVAVGSCWVVLRTATAFRGGLRRG